MVAHLTPGQASSSHYFYSNTLHTLSQGVHIHQSSRLNAWLTTPRYRGQLGSPMYLLQRCSPLECVIRNKNSWGLKNLGSVQLSLVWHKVSINIKIKNSKTLQQVPTYLHFLVGTKIAQIFFSDAFRVVFWSFFDFCWWKFWVTNGQETSLVFKGKQFGPKIWSRLKIKELNLSNCCSK